jgi:Sulfotransferase family
MVRIIDEEPTMPDPMQEPVDLSETALLAEAQARANLEDFGDDDFREGLRALLAMYDGAARLTPQGRKATRRRILELLTNRLFIQDTFVKHPEIRARPIRRPMYLTGLPRTGTSALFNLLAIDEASRPLLYWEGCYPYPFPGAAPGAPDPRLAALAQALERMRQKDPEFAKIHEVKADGPEECVQLLAHTLGGVQLGIEPLISPYREWFEKQDLRAPYAYYADLLRMLDWQRPGERWLLKSPAHLWALDLLVGMFPDACIIQTHREPAQIIGSYCSMVAMLMRGREGVDPRELGPTVLEYLARSVERGMAARDELGPARFVDVDYRQFVKDPMGSVERIYDAFQLELTPRTGAAMRKHIADHPQNKHGAHTYTLADYGLTAETVSKRLARYIERFELDRAG